MENRTGNTRDTKTKRGGAKILLALIIAVGLLSAGVYGYYWYYNTENFFKTDNASVAASTVTITPLLTGSLQSWSVREGDDVRSGQVLGRQDVGSMVSSSAINPQSLQSSADSIASKADIKSPIDGKIVQSNVIPGQTVSPGMTLALVADTRNTYIKANIEETVIFKIRKGQTVEVKIDAWPGRLFNGYVESVGQATQSAFSLMPSLNTSGTYSKTTQIIPVKINIDNPDDLPLLLGMNASVKIRIK